MKNFIEKVINFINELKSLFSKDKEVENKVEAPKVVKPSKPSKNVTPVVQEEVEVVDPHNDEIEVSQDGAKITSFLVKPVSDTNPKILVFSVSCDLARAEDVKIKIKDKKGKVLKVKDTYNSGGSKRGNRLPGHKYGRFNFKPGPTAEEFKKSAPLEVSFTVNVNGKSQVLPVMGKDSIIVKDPTKRLDLK